MQHNSVCEEHDSSQDIGGKYFRGGILRSEAIYFSFEDIWLSNLHPYSYGEENKVGTFMIEGYICGV